MTAKAVAMLKNQRTLSATRCTSWKFNLAIGIFCGSILALLLFFIFVFFTFGEAEILAYQDLVEKAGTANKEKQLPTTAQQKRRGIRKDILFTKGHTQLSFNLVADESSLKLNHKSGSAEVVEELTHVKGLMQEELYYQLPDGREVIPQENGKLLLRNGDPNEKHSWIDSSHPFLIPMQTLRYFEAELATYHYKDNYLEAHEVTVARYTVSGHAFVSSIEGYKPMMSGIAHSMELSFTSPTPQFKAKQLKAIFYEGGQ